MDDIANTHRQDDQHGHRDVTIFVNDRTCEIRRGRWLVSDLKQACGVPLADELSIVEHGKLRLLENEAHVVIQGGEHFVAHPRTGGAS